MTCPRNTSDPIEMAMDHILEDQERRHAWLSVAARQIEEWKAEDEAKGEPWGTGLGGDL